jgi:hypothetical protein
VWIFISPRKGISSVFNTITGKLKLFREKTSGRTSKSAVAIHSIANGVRNIQARGVVLPARATHKKAIGVQLSPYLSRCNTVITDIPRTHE